jgi:penicillin-binding protein 1A
MWMSYMGKVLKDVPEAEYTMPDNMAAVRINDHGLRDPDGGRIEYFYQENIPAAVGDAQSGDSAERIDSVKDQLF